MAVDDLVAEEEEEDVSVASAVAKHQLLHERMSNSRAMPLPPLDDRSVVFILIDYELVLFVCLLRAVA